MQCKFKNALYEYLTLDQGRQLQDGLKKFTEYRLTVPDLSLSSSSFSIAVSIFAAIRAFSWEIKYPEYMNSIMLYLINFFFHR